MNLTPEMIVGIATLLGACIAWLARDQVASKRRCERESTECRVKHADLDRFIRETLVGIVSENAVSQASATAELIRARRAIERAEHRHPRTGDETPVVPQRAHG